MLCCSGSVLPAHRAVLVARCDVMAAMFSGKYAEARSRVVPIHGVSSDTFLAFLEYLYTDTCCPGESAPSAFILSLMSRIVASSSSPCGGIYKKFYYNDASLVLILHMFYHSKALMDVVLFVLNIAGSKYFFTENWFRFDCQ